MSTESRCFKSIKTPLEWAAMLAERQFEGVTDEGYVNDFNQKLKDEVANAKREDLDAEELAFFEKVKADMQVDPSRNSALMRLIMLSGILKSLGKLGHNVEINAKDYTKAYRKWIEEGAVGEFAHKIEIKMDREDKACYDSIVATYAAAGIPASMLVCKVVTEEEEKKSVRSEIERIIGDLQNGKMPEGMEISVN